MTQSRTHSLCGRRIGVTAERRVSAQIRFIESRGGDVIEAPVLRTLSNVETPELRAMSVGIVDSPPDVFVVQTGQGLRWWIDNLDSLLQQRVVAALRDIDVWTRGTKATTACRHLGIEPSWTAPNETVVDIIDRLRTVDLVAADVAVQSDGADRLSPDSPSAQLLAALRDCAASVRDVEVYRYSLPDDLGPGRQLVLDVLAGRVDAVTFTSSPAIRHFRAIADTIGRVDDLDLAFVSRCHAVVVGPVCASTARSFGWECIVQPDQARLLPMLEAMESQLRSVSAR